MNAVCRMRDCAFFSLGLLLSACTTAGGQPSLETGFAIPLPCPSSETLCYCLKEQNPLRNPKDPIQLSVWEDFHKPQKSGEHKLQLPPGFIYDFMPLGKDRALFVYEDGQVLEVTSWQEVSSPIARGALRLTKLAGRVYIVVGPLLVENSAILRVEGKGLKTVWTGVEVPAEMAALSKNDLLIRLEESSSGRSKILLLESKPGGEMAPKILWSESE